MATTGHPRTPGPPTGADVPAAGGQADLVAAVRAALRSAADPARAAGMQAYMKSAQPFFGVGVPEVRRLTVALARERPPSSVAELREAATALWRGATHREERYAAVALTGLPMARGSLALLPLYEEMITTGAWWDHVDGVAPRVRELLLDSPATMTPRVRDWARSSDRWLRRGAVTAQLGAKARTDRALLTEVVEVNAADPEFFVRKAIGWALRDFARTDPDWVRRFLADHELSPLSRREAAKHLG